MITNHKIIIGDSRNMEEIEDRSIDLIITSPPYWQLKDYGVNNQIGFNDSYEAYINNLNLVWDECYRVLNNGCRLCINIGDQFARSVYYGRYKIIPIRTEIIKFCEIRGFDYMGAIIWQKETTMNTSGGGSVMGSFPYPRNGIIKIDYEFILIFKKSGKSKPVDKQLKNASVLSKKEWFEYFSGHWNFGGTKQDKHLAMFPKELPKRLIKMFSFVQDTILDPFVGSGTTSVVAKELERNSIGYEINREYIPIIKHKFGFQEHSLFNNFSIEFLEQNKSRSSYNDKISTLPYQFHDPVKINKKTDPRMMSFGSKISSLSIAGNEKEDGFLLEEVLDPERILLKNGIKVRLIGIRNNLEKTESAINFIKSKTKGQKLFLKFDSEKYDNEGFLLSYVYLKNKTFLNLHLIKNGLTHVDTQLEYRLRSKFIKIGGIGE